MSIQYFPENIRKFVEELASRQTDFPPEAKSGDKYEALALTNQSVVLRRAFLPGYHDDGKGVETNTAAR